MSSIRSIIPASHSLGTEDHLLLVSKGSTEADESSKRAPNVQPWEKGDRCVARPQRMDPNCEESGRNFGMLRTCFHYCSIDLRTLSEKQCAVLSDIRLGFFGQICRSFLPALCCLANLNIRVVGSKLIFSFYLPRGSYNQTSMTDLPKEAELCHDFAVPIVWDCSSGAINILHHISRTTILRGTIPHLRNRNKFLTTTAALNEP
jgi:hypothetical protein